MDRRKSSPARRSDADRRTVRLNVHGLAAELRCSLPGMRQMLGDLFAPMIVDAWPEGFVPVTGSVEPYDAETVARHLSPQADRVAILGDRAELWRDGERCWLLDDSWGLSEINLLRRTFRSWVLAPADLEPLRAVEQAILWPLAQVLMSRGLSLVPAASVVHRGRGVLLLSPFSLEPELTALVEAGHGLIGQRWTSVREEDGRFVLLQMPGRVERAPVPHLRSRASAILSIAPTQSSWIDLAATAAASTCSYAWCDAILSIEPGRRAAPRITALSGASASAAIRRAWPMPDAGPLNRQAQLATRVAQAGGVYQIELSRDPRALLRLLEQMPGDPSQRSMLVPSVTSCVAEERVAV